MEQTRPIVRIILVGAIVFTSVLTFGELRVFEPALVAGQAPALLPGQTSPDDVDMTPAERSAEVQALLLGTTFSPDLGEPAGAIKKRFGKRAGESRRGYCRGRSISIPINFWTRQSR